MSENQAMKEIEESMVLSLFLEKNGIDMEDPQNFSDTMVYRAKKWYATGVIIEESRTSAQKLTNEKK